jgi:hypothetical protein
LVDLSALALLVSGVAADHQQLAMPAHQLAVLTDALDTRTYLHVLVASSWLCNGGKNVW